MRWDEKNVAPVQQWYAGRMRGRVRAPLGRRREALHSDVTGMRRSNAGRFGACAYGGSCHRSVSRCIFLNAARGQRVPPAQTPVQDIWIQAFAGRPRPPDPAVSLGCSVPSLFHAPIHCTAPSHRCIAFWMRGAGLYRAPGIRPRAGGRKRTWARTPLISDPAVPCSPC